MQLIIGTKNQAKVDQIRSVLEPLGFDVQSLPDREYPEVREEGKSVVENARIKAVTYASTIGKTVLSMDNGLYFNSLAPSEQPGMNVRRISGATERPSADELLTYYTNLIKQLGGRVNGYWEFGLCLATPEGKMGETAIRSPRVFVSIPSKAIISGYPLDSLQIDPDSGVYISDMPKAERDSFWRRTIGSELAEFIKKSVILS